MLPQFLHLYDFYRWLRYTTWTILLLLFLCLVYAASEFVPALWSMFQHPSTDSVLTLLTPFFWLILWLCSWVLLLRICWLLLHHQSVTFTLEDEQADGVWTPVYQVSLAGSSVEGRALMSGMTKSMPRLRLPQKPVYAFPKTATIPHSTSVVPSMQTEARRSFQDQPTRPENAGPIPGPKVANLPVQPLQIGIGWNSGIVRRHDPNEDGLAVLQATCTYQSQLVPFALFVIADGMGGQECGQEASRIAVQHMLHNVLLNVIMGHDLSDDFLADMLIGGVEWANLAIHQAAQSAGIEMGTTLTAAMIVGMKAYIVNVGDSRTYLFREGVGLKPVTHDHSLVASLVAKGVITPEEVYTHPERNKVYRCLGSEENLKVDLFTIDLWSSDRLLLCSDGLWEMVHDPVLERIVRSNNNMVVTSDTLVQAALRGGGGDNISVIMVQIP